MVSSRVPTLPATDQQISEHSPHQVDHRQIVIVASTMRSGSTLLKALLATAPDISDLPEVNFQRFVNPSMAPRAWALAAQRIVLLKRPAWYHETWTYPRIPESLHPKSIVLVRDAWETVRSIRRMTFGILGALVPRTFDRWLLLNYWLPITERLVRLADEQPDCTKLIRYEDLVADPRGVTSQLFEFVGSRRREGVDAYQIPKRGPWRWWTDDNSLHLQSLRVQKSREETRPSAFFEKLLKTESRVVALRSRLGYSGTS